MYTKKATLQGEVVPVAELTPEAKARMFDLLDSHFENTSLSAFVNDLNEKQWAILLRDPVTGVLQGFSTQMVLLREIEGVRIRVLFSGDTIVNREWWGDIELTRMWGRFALELLDKDHSTPLYWFLISQGFRTYRFLPLYFHAYYPNANRPTPLFEKKLIDKISAERYAERYDSAAGVIRADSKKDYLRLDVAPLTDGRCRNSHIRFFAAMNPGHIQGDELACIAEISRNNFKPIAMRVFSWKTR